MANKEKRKKEIKKVPKLTQVEKRKLKLDKKRLKKQKKKKNR